MILLEFVEIRKQNNITKVIIERNGKVFSECLMWQNTSQQLDVASYFFQFLFSFFSVIVSQWSYFYESKKEWLKYKI